MREHWNEESKGNIDYFSAAHFSREIECIRVKNASSFAAAIYPLCSSVALFLIFPVSLLLPDAWIALGRRDAARALQEIAKQ